MALSEPIAKEQEVSEMVADIVKARNGGQSTEVYAPVYDCPITTKYSEIAGFPISNRIEGNGGDGTSILSKLDSAPRLLDISGRTVGMVSKIGDDIFTDTVEVVGETKQSYTVKINGVDYSVRKSIVRFVTGVY